jgi:hypothetical protein
MNRFLLFLSLVLTATLACGLWDFPSAQDLRAEAYECSLHVSEIDAQAMADCYRVEYYNQVASRKENYAAVMDELAECFGDAVSQGPGLAEASPARGRCLIEADDKLGLSAPGDEEEGESKADTSGYHGDLNVLTVEPVKQVCAPKQLESDHHCIYEVEVQVSHNANSEGAYLECEMKETASLYGATLSEWKRVEEGEGIWNFKFIGSGFYSTLGPWTLKISCSMLMPDRNGVPVAEDNDGEVDLNFVIGEF